MELFSQRILCDRHLVMSSYQTFGDITFAAYEGSDIIGVIGGYRIEESIFINSFHYDQNAPEGLKERLAGLLLRNFPANDMMVMAHEGEKALFESLGFAVHSRFSQALYSGEKVAFNFTSAMSKRISGENYIPILKSLDRKAFGIERSEYLLSTIRHSSLVLSTQVGFQHSYALDKGLVKIAPWVMSDGAYTDAEQLMRGVLYHRGLKKVLSIIPVSIPEIRELYTSYGFKLTDNMVLMYKGARPDIDLEMVYAF